MSKESTIRHIEKSAVQDRDAGRYDPPKTWVPAERQPLGSPERNAYENINPKDGK